MLNKTDKLSQAVFRLLDAGVTNFRSCADACLWHYTRLREDKSLPGFKSWADVFYGLSVTCSPRIEDWQTSQPPCKRARRSQKSALGLLHHTVLGTHLRDVGRHAADFIAAVRALPHFRPTWENARTPGGKVRDGHLGACERRFNKHFKAASELLAALPICVQDKYDRLLLLGRRIPAAVARHVLSFLVRAAPVHIAPSGESKP